MRACSPNKKLNHDVVGMKHKRNLGQRKDLDGIGTKYQERHNTPSVEDSGVSLFEKPQEVKGEQTMRNLQGQTCPLLKKQKRGMLGTTGIEDLPKQIRPNIGMLRLTDSARQKLQAQSLAVNCRSLIQDAVDSTSEPGLLKHSYSSEGMKNEELRKCLQPVKEMNENGARVCNDGSFDLAKGQLSEFQKEKITGEFPLCQQGSRMTESLSDTSEKNHSRGRKKVATVDLPPDELRCIRSDGRSWRCTAYAVPGGKRCQKHHLQLLAAQKRQQMNKGSTFVRVTSGKPRSQPSDFGIVTEGLHRSEPPSYNLHEKVVKKLLPHPSRLDVQKSSNISIPSNKSDIVHTKLKISNEKGQLCSSGLSPNHTGKGQTKCSPDGDFEQGKSCHQCQRNERGAIIFCVKCNRRYCLCCLTKWYPDLSEQEVAKACPSCRGRCVCKLCPHSKGHSKEEVHMNKLERLKCLHYLLAIIIPFLKQLNEDQRLELELETTLRGHPITKLVRAPIGRDDCVLCDHCGTSIVDFHRSCPDCDYDLCLTCCKELRQGKQPGAENPLPSPELPGKELRPEEVDQIPTDNISLGNVPTCSHSDESLEKATSEAVGASGTANKVEFEISHVASQSTVWRANEDGSIPCAPAERGCGSPFLILKSLHRANYLENLVKEVEGFGDCSVVPCISECESCAICDAENPVSTGKDSSFLRLAAQRSNMIDNHIYTTHYQDAKDRGLQHFQRHWVRGEPVIVKDVHRALSDVCWEPMAMWRATQELARSYMHYDSKFVTAIDCFNWREVDVSIYEFLNGYEVGYIDHSGSPKMMKLDWPSSNIFGERLPRHYAEFTRCIPFAEYTHPKKGILNLAAKFPEGAAKPDLGPKSYIAYGVDGELGIGDSVTKLQIGASDMVCVLVHTSETKLTPGQWKQAHHSREIHEAGSETSQDAGPSGKVFDQRGLKRCTKVGEKDFHMNSILHGHKTPEDVELHVPVELSDDEYLYMKESAPTSQSSFMNNPVLRTEKGRWETETAVKSKDLPSCSSEETNMEQNDSSQKQHHGELAYASESNDGIVGASSSVRVIEHGGAVWDVFRRQDVPKLREYIEKHLKESKYRGASEVVHPLHDQFFFLNEEHKRKLKEEFQIEPWTFEQNLGEAVFIPAGCPYQVRNLKSCTKVALDFVSPESLQESLRVTEECRLLPINHHANEDKLQVRNMIVHAASQAVTEIKRLKADKRRMSGWSGFLMSAGVQGLQSFISRTAKINWVF
ncbi:hypothetical protein O6H91_02G153700 [Diphasiastrum complanatum]|nr:hypothetical protein O6H91_02G153700 [Diphasiastrum complanatum]